LRGFLVNKNLCLYYWLRKRVGRKWAFRLAISAEKTILIFGREPIHNKEFLKDTQMKEKLGGGEGDS
jgi:hypothetical protein